MTDVSDDELRQLRILHEMWPGAIRRDADIPDHRALAERVAESLIAGDTTPILEMFEHLGSSKSTIAWDPDEAMVDHPVLAFLRRHWHDRLSNVGLPRSAEIDPLELSPALGWIMLLDPLEDPPDFRYRLYGSRIAEFSQIDMTGKRVGDIRSPLVAALFLATYRAVFLSHLPLLTAHQTQHGSRRALWNRLILPYVDSAGAVSRLLTGNVVVVRKADA